MKSHGVTPVCGATPLQLPNQPAICSLCGSSERSSSCLRFVGMGFGGFRPWPLLLGIGRLEELAVPSARTSNPRKNPCGNQDENSKQPIKERTRARPKRHKTKRHKNGHATGQSPVLGHRVEKDLFGTDCLVLLDVASTGHHWTACCRARCG